MDEFLENYNLPKHTGLSNNLRSPTVKKFFVKMFYLNIFFTKKTLNGFIEEVYQTFKEEIMCQSYKLYEKIEVRTLFNSFYEAIVILICKLTKTVPGENYSSQSSRTQMQRYLIEQYIKRVNISLNSYPRCKVGLIS